MPSPPPADAVQALPDGRVRVDFKAAWRSGAARADRFLAQLCALVPPPGFRPIERNGSGLTIIGIMAAISSGVLLTIGTIMRVRFRRAQLAVQQTPRGTWTTGITLRF